MPLIRSLPRRPSAALLAVLCGGLAASGCRRAVRPDLGQDRVVEAGVPVELGSRAKAAPVVTWELADGTQAKKSASVSHAFARAGTYVVRALDGSEEVGRVQLTVVPRPLLRAVPAEARMALWVPRLRGTVEPLVDFYERLAGAERARRVLEETPLVPLLLRSLDDADRGVVDPEEGFGFFLLPRFEGVVALLGVTEPAAALDAVAKELESAGHGVRRQADGSALVDPAEGGWPMLLFADRGYVYLAVPDAPEEVEAGTPIQALAVTPTAPDVESVRRLVAGLSGPGLSEAALLGELRGKVAEGGVYLFSEVEREAGEEPSPVRGAFASLGVSRDRMELDGFLASTRPLLNGASAPASEVMARGAEGPVAAAQLSVPPEEMAKLAFGSPGSPRRERTLQRWKSQGLDGEALLKALRGDVAMLVYFDAPAFLRGLVRNRKPEPKGSVTVEAGLVSAEPVQKLFTQQLEESSLRYESKKLGSATVFTTRVLEQPVEVSIAPQRATLLAGEPLTGRRTEDVGAALRTRFGEGVFSAGHSSLMVDLGRLRAELQAPREVPGVSAVELLAAQAIAGALLDQLTPLESAFLDVSPVEGGARLKGRVTLAGSREASR